MLYFLYVGALFNFFVASSIGVSIFLKDKKNIINQTCAFFSLAVSLWSIFYFFPIVGDNKILSLCSFRLLHIGANYISISKLHFYFALLGEHKKNKKLLIFLHIILGVFTVLMPTKFFIPEVVPKFDFPYWARIGVLYKVWLSIWMIIEVYAVGYLFSYFLKSDGIKRQIFKYILIGNLIFIPGGLSNFFLFFDINIIPYFSFLVAFMPLSIAYIILRYRTFSFSYKIISFGKPIFTIVSSLGISFFIIQFLEKVISKIEILYLFFLLSFLFLFHGFKKIINSKIFLDALRLSELHSFNFAIQIILEKRVFYENFDELKNNLENVFIKNLNIEYAKIYFPINKKKPKYPNLTEYFKDFSREKFIVREELSLKQKDKKRKSSLLLELENFAEVCLPIYHVGNHEIIGFFVLGKQKYNNPYSVEQLKKLEELGQYLSLSLTVIYYNKFLQDEIKNKTKLLDTKNKKLKKSYEKLKELDKERDEFLAVASHELRTPITIIKGYTSLFIEESFGEVNKEQKNYLKKIFSGSEQLLLLVNNMLDIQKLKAKKMVFNIKTIDNQEIVTEMIENFKHMYQKKNINLDFKVKKNTKVNADPNKLKQVFNNLLSNAYKFTPEKGKVKVEVKKYKEDEQFFEFIVTDNGIGIPDKLKNKIFEKFYQIDSYLSRDVEGTGLGLPIVKSIIEEMKGEIWVESKLKTGTSFHFILPENS